MRPHGWIILDKPLDLGSTQAVGAVKRNLREAGLLGKGKNKLKVGHGGTLDPLATGVLPIAIGEATKLCGRMLDASKIYKFTIGFGSETETLDVEGDVTETSGHRPTLAEIEAVLPQFTGSIEQIPPKYSALKIDGKRAYDLARAGEAVEMKMRSVTIYSLEIGHPELDSGFRASSGNGSEDSPWIPDQVRNDVVQEVTLTAHVSKGTYIRSLARDIARACGTFGHVTMLRRMKAGPFTLERAISLDKLNEIGKGADVKDYLLPLEAGLDDIPAFDLTPDQAKRLRQGLTLGEETLIGNPAQKQGTHGLFLATENAGSPVALAELVDGTIKVVRGFNM